MIRSLLLLLASCAGLAACASGDDPQPEPAAVPESLEEAYIADITRDLADDDMQGRNEGTTESAEARARIIAEMGACGIEPAGEGSSYEQPITAGQGTNVLGVIPGTDPDLRDRYVVVSAHYDHIGACGGAICNGANDNAAGVATILGVGCAVAQAPLTRSVLIAAWDAEEPATFLTDAMGSEFWVNEPTVPLSSVDVAIALDLVGGDLWPGFDAHFLIGAELSPQVASAVNRAARPDGLDAHRLGLHMVEETILGRQPWSDYDAFRNEEVPVLFASNGQNREYHTPDDEFELLDTPRMALQAQYLYAIVRELGDATETPVFDAAGVAFATDAETAVMVLDAALADGGLVDQYGLSGTSRTNLEADRELAAEVAASLEAGTGMSNDELLGLRTATQRIMCHAGSTYGEGTCNSL